MNNDEIPVKIFKAFSVWIKSEIEDQLVLT
jgi:hypothetical protein